MEILFNLLISYYIKTILFKTIKTSKSSKSSTCKGTAKAWFDNIES